MPKGFSVLSRKIRISFLSSSASRIPPVPISPKAPASEQAAAKLPVAIFAIPPWIIGYRIPSISFNRISSPFLLLSKFHFKSQPIKSCLIFSLLICFPVNNLYGTEGKSRAKADKE